MKTHSKISLNKIIIAVAILASMSSLISCSVDEMEPINPTVTTKTIFINEQFLQRGDSLQNTGKINDSIPTGEIVPPIPPKK